MAKIVNEISGVVFSLPWLVARDEGLFKAEGVEVEFVNARTKEEDLARIVADHRLVPSIGPHVPFEDNQVAIYRACEWGQIRRSYDSERGGHIVGKRSAVGVQAIFSAPGSSITHPQALKNRPIGVRFHRGSHYATLQILEGYLHRDEIKVVHIDVAEAYEAVRSGELAAVTIMEPWITLAEKEGFQKIAEVHYLGTEIASADVDKQAWRAIDRAIKQAVRLINADKKKYVHYLIESLPEKYRARITSDDFHLPRLRYVDPAPYSREEFDQTNEWLIRWGLVEPDSKFDRQVDNRIQGLAVR
jgi:NitT/TauT family transport system substrate-binding protein